MYKIKKIVHTLNRGDKMKRQLKKSVVYGLYGLSAFLFIVGIFMLGIIATRNTDQKDFNYLEVGLFDKEEDIIKVNSSPKFIRPYIASDVTVVKSFYDYKADKDAQEKSLIYYENTYIQSSGVSYSNGSSFDVISVLDGVVKEVVEDETLGNIITIEHSDNIITTYQSITDIKIKAGDQIKQGDIIAKSSTSNISTDLENHLYFELIVNGKCVNPESYYDKQTSEI